MYNINLVSFFFTLEQHNVNTIFIPEIVYKDKDVATLKLSGLIMPHLTRQLFFNISINIIYCQSDVLLQC